MTPSTAPAWASPFVAPASEIRVLGERQGTPHVVAATSRRGAPVVVKRYDGPEGARAVEAMRAVRRAVGSASPLAVPGIVAWDARRRVLLQTMAPGCPLLPRLESTEWRPSAIAAARALAALHGSRVPLGRTASMADHLVELIHPAPQVVAAAVPAWTLRIERLISALLAWDAARRPPNLVLIHRDVHARQMTYDGDRVWLVDWDLAARGDPALDVANFAVYLRTHLGARGTRAAEVFLDAYEAHVPGAGARDRVAVYEAFTYLRLACKQWRLQAPGWRRRSEQRLWSAERAAARVSPA